MVGRRRGLARSALGLGGGLGLENLLVPPPVKVVVSNVGCVLVLGLCPLGHKPNI